VYICDCVELCNFWFVCVHVYMTMNVWCVWGVVCGVCGVCVHVYMTMNVWCVCGVVCGMRVQSCDYLQDTCTHIYKHFTCTFVCVCVCVCVCVES